MTLPPGWVEAKITELTEPVKQRIPDADEVIDYIDIGSIDRETKRINTCQNIIGNKAPSRARKVVRPGDVLVSMTRPNLNAVALVPDGFENPIASTGFEVLRSEIVDPRWFFAQVRGSRFVNEMSDLVQGALYPAIRSSDVQDYSLALPPLDEQKRIADKLDQTLAIVERAKARLARVPEILKQFRQSVLAAATDGRLTEDWRVNNSHGEQWSHQELGKISEKITDGEHQTPRRCSNGRYLLSARNIQNGKIVLDDVDYVDDSEFERIRKRCGPAIGDVLLSCSGSVGRAALVDKNNAYVMVRSAALIRPMLHLITPTFLMYCIQSPNLQEQIKEKSSATAQANIFIGSIKSLRLAVPTLAEQLEIVRRVETLFALADRIEARYQAISEKVDKLTQSLLAKAFRGELVPQDPNDEPASVLLERIHAQRAAAPVSKAGRRKRENASA